MSLKGFHIVFIIFSTLLALGIGAWCIWVDLVEGAPVYLAGAIASFVRRGRADRLRRLVLPENETAAYHHMKTRIVSLLLLSILLAARAGDGLPVLLRREGWKIDRAHGSRDLVSVRRGHVRVSAESARSVFISGVTGACRSNRTRSLTDEDLSKYD